MKFLSTLVLASMAVAAPSKRAPTPLDVKLEMVSNSEVKATVTNNGKNNLKLFKSGTFLDSAPVEKVTVLSGEDAIRFDGVRLLLSTENLEDDAFEHIPSGESLEVTFDVAELHGLSTGGAFKISTSGAFSFAEESSNALVGSIPFDSNLLETEVDGEAASAVHITFHERRSRVQSDCTGTRLTASQTALSDCVTIATVGQNAASSGSAAKMTEFFKSSTTSTRNTVANVFSRMRSECRTNTSGVSTWSCTGFYGGCSSGVIAYTVPGLSAMAYCSIFWNLPAMPSGCYTQTRGSTAVHEVTHLSQIAGTSDYGGYGYNFVRSLSAAQNLNHADTYTLFAQSIYAGC